MLKYRKVHYSHSISSVGSIYPRTLVERVEVYWIQTSTAETRNIFVLGVLYKVYVWHFGDFSIYMWYFWVTCRQRNLSRSIQSSIREKREGGGGKKGSESFSIPYSIPFCSIFFAIISSLPPEISRERSFFEMLFVKDRISNIGVREWIIFSEWAKSFGSSDFM